MIDWINKYMAPSFSGSSYSSFAITTILLLIIFSISWLSNYIAKRYITKITGKLFSSISPNLAQSVEKNKVINWATNVIPGIILYLSANLFIDQQINWIHYIGVTLKQGAYIFTISSLSITFIKILSAVNEIYTLNPISNRLPINTYIQVFKFIILACTIIIISAHLLEISPLVIFTGLGAATAVIAFIFKDPLLGLVASIQITTYDMIRIGDWVTIPSFNADGDVIEISLAIVKIQNFDKTIVYIPTSSLLSSSIQNWRGMQESGGRRIKRAIKLDLSTLKICSKQDLENYKNIALISDFAQLASHDEIPSNLRMYREYITRYLQNHPQIHKKPGFTFLVRTLDPTETGIPIEIYVFTNDTNWANYENIQSRIFEHLLSVLPWFDLKTFQTLYKEPSAT